MRLSVRISPVIGGVALESLRQHARPVDLRILAAGVVAWALGALIAFRAVVLSLFDVVFGDGGDGRLIVYLHEHLFNALRGRADFLSPPIFYPQKNVLGFTDAFVLDILPYAALRSIGLDPFLSEQTWAIILSLFCFLASLIIGTRYLRLRPAFGIGASALVAFPNNLMFKTAHAHINFFALYYLPCILLLALWSVEDFPQLSRWSLALVGLAAAFLALLFSTGYYTAWMFAFTAAIAICAAAVLLRQDVIAAVRTYYRPFALLAATAMFGFGLGLIPLVLIYAPVLHVFPFRTFAEYLAFAPLPGDVINVGRWNMVWGHLVERLVDAGGAERTLAVTPVMTAAFLIVTYQLLKRSKEGDRRPWPLIFVVACAAVWVLSWMLTVRIGSFSLFWLPYHIVPGAAAIRVGGRIQLLVNLWIVAGLAVALQYWIDTGPNARKWRRVLLSSAILIFCLVEQINLLPASLWRSQEFAWLSAVPEAPAQCRVFLVDVPSRQANYFDENDAMWISLRTGLPTINGSSGWMPYGWRLDDHTIDYFDAAREWIASTGLEQTVCLYSRSNRSWSTFLSPHTHPLGSGLRDRDQVGFADGQAGVPMLAEGWSRPEGWGVWGIGEHSTLNLRLGSDLFQSTDVNLRVTIGAFLPPGIDGKRIEVFLGEPTGARPFAQWKLTRTPTEKELCIQANAIPRDRLVKITFQADHSYSPAEAGMSTDSRFLNIALQSLSAHSEPCSNSR